MIYKQSISDNGRISTEYQHLGGLLLLLNNVNETVVVSSSILSHYYMNTFSFLLLPQQMFHLETRKGNKSAKETNMFSFSVADFIFCSDTFGKLASFKENRRSSLHFIVSSVLLKMY